MSSEAELVIEIWETVRDHIPAPKRSDLAKELLYIFADYGFTASDLTDIVDEDPDLTDAYEEVFEPMEIEDEEDRYDEDE